MSLISLAAALIPAVSTVQTAGVAVRGSTLQGLPLCVWNDSSIFTRLRPGMQEHYSRVFRFPNGSYSDIYHWNGSGKFDQDSVWVPDSAVATAGWSGRSVHRGLTSAPYFSLIDDGDTSTYWWSNPDHPDAPGWFMLDFGASKALDSFAVWLGAVRPDSVEIVRWTGGATYPVAYQPPLANITASSNWTSVARLPTAGGFAGIRLGSSARSQYFGVRPLGAALHDGWQVAEFKAFSGATRVTSNVASTSQTTVYAVSTHPSSRDAGVKFNWNFDGYMAWIRNYPGAIPMVCVNFGTGTPREAAAWVHYANKVKNYGVKRWQIGNENSYYWEEGGCVSARQYAERFVQYARAMKAEDPTIEVYGPVYAGTDFTTQSSGDFDGRSWMEGVLSYVDSAEKATKERLMHGVDFHTYPYWFTTSPSADDMLKACDGNGAAFDTLGALMSRTIADPDQRQVVMSEFNVSSATGSIEMEASAGTGAGLLFAHFIQRFGDRGLTNLWELNSDLAKGSDNTYGSLGAFTKPTQGEKSSLSFPPNASFWTTRTIMRQWLDTAGGDTIVGIGQTAGLRTFAVRNHGRVSVLAFNLGADSAALALDPTLFPAGGDVLSWGTGEYEWIGTDASARAIPDNGPSSRSFKAWDGSAKVPPHGMLAVRAAGRSALPIRTVHWLASSTNLGAADSLVVSGWTTLEGSKLQGGTWSCGGASGALSATDGAWDGPSESWVVRIPASGLPAGAQVFRFSVADASGAESTDSVSIKVSSGGLRPVVLISDFQTRKAVTTFNDSSWYGYGTEGNSYRMRIDSAGRGSWFLKDSMSLVLDAAIGYTYESVSAPMPAATVLDSLNALYDLVGVVFDYSTKSSSPSATFGFSADLPESMTAYNSHGTELRNTAGAWVRDTILFSNLTQASGWGKSCDFVLDSTKQLTFRANGAGNSVVKIDNLAFMGTSGDDYMVGVRQQRHAPISMAVSGRRLAIEVDGPWTVRLFSVDGSQAGRWVGAGAATLALPRLRTTSWAVLESKGARKVVSIAPVLK